MTGRHQSILNSNVSQFGVWVILLSLCLLLSACEKDNNELRMEQPIRTVLFYMAGDNNLSSEVNAKIEHIKATPLSPYCRVLIYADTKDGLPKLSEVINSFNGNTLVLLREYDESNSADAGVLASILTEMRILSPTSSYGLVLFSHATGWLPAGAYNNPVTRSVLMDGATEMEIPAFAAAIPNKMFDFIVFEACYMAGVEVAYELKDKTRYIIASSAEMVSPGIGNCYIEALPYLYAEQIDLIGFCETVKADYASRPDGYNSLTLSLIITAGMDVLASTVKELGLPSAEELEHIQAFDRGDGDLFFDLEDSYKGMLINNCVEWKTATASFLPSHGGFDIVTHCGLTTYIRQEKYPRLNEAYKGLAWYRAVTENIVSMRDRDSLVCL